jgi:hypothetical protein
MVPPAFHGRRLIALFCLTALLFAVLATDTGTSVWAVLVPFWLLIEIIVIVSAARARDDHDLYSEPSLSTAPSRAPPIQ